MSTEQPQWAASARVWNKYARKLGEVDLDKLLLEAETGGHETARRALLKARKPSTLAGWAANIKNSSYQRATSAGIYYPDAPRGRLGWPLIASLAFPGEKCLACPNCGSRDVTLTSAMPLTGTGPNGRPRMGDVGVREMNRCENCGHRTVESDKNPVNPNDRRDP